MAEKPRPNAMLGPVGVAAVFADIEAKGPHVLRPMRLGLHHHGDTAADLFQGSERSVGGLSRSSRNISSMSIKRVIGLSKARPGHEDRAAWGWLWSGRRWPGA